jgi:hypothetical protein
MPEQNLASVAEELANQLQDLTDELVAMRSRGRRWIGAVIAVVVFGFLSMGVTFILAAADARAQDRENDRRWCALLDATTTPVPSGTPNTPATARQRAILAELNALRRDLGCV